MRHILLALLLPLGSVLAQNSGIESNPRRSGVEYVTTATSSILDRAADEIRNAAPGTLVAVVAPYILSKNFADAMSEARRNGANVILIAQEAPPVENYTGLDYLARNRVVIYTENIPESTECYVIVNSTMSVLILNIPPDPTFEAKYASMYLLHANNDLRKVLLESFGQRVKNAKEYKNTGTNLTPIEKK